MRARSINGLFSLVFTISLGATACSGAAPDDSVGTQRQPLKNLCRLPTVGAACDPDGDGPASPCDGVCVVDGKSASGASCSRIDWSANEGAPCGSLEEGRVDCVRSCRGGVCTTSSADDESPCMVSGSPYFSAVCEGACSAGTCLKLAKPKDCPVSSDDAGSGSGDDTGGGGSVDGDGLNLGDMGTLGVPLPSLTGDPTVDSGSGAVPGPDNNNDAGVTPANDPNAGTLDGSTGNDGGCGCRTVPAGSPLSSAASIAAVATALVAIRARRRR